MDQRGVGRDTRSRLLGGINHVAVLTGDTRRFVEFYRDVFDATHDTLEASDQITVTAVWIGAGAELNVFELAGNREHERQTACPACSTHRARRRRYHGGAGAR